MTKLLYTFDENDIYEALEASFIEEQDLDPDFDLTLQEYQEFNFQYYWNDEEVVAGWFFDRWAKNKKILLTGEYRRWDGSGSGYVILDDFEALLEFDENLRIIADTRLGVILAQYNNHDAFNVLRLNFISDYTAEQIENGSDAVLARYASGRFVTTRASVREGGYQR